MDRPREMEPVGPRVGELHQTGSGTRDRGMDITHL